MVTQSRPMGPVETELRRTNEMLGAVYSEIVGRFPLMTEGQSQVASRELDTLMSQLRADYASHPDIHPTRERALSDLYQMARNDTLHTTIDNILHPPTPAWVRTLDYIQTQVLHMANIDPSMAALLAPELDQAIQATKTRFWFQPTAPTTAELLTDLRQRLTDTRLLAAIDQILSPPASVPFRVEPPQPEPEQAAPAPAARPARRYAAPTVAELQRDGFGNLVDTNIGGTIYRFAAKDSSLDIIGMNTQELMDYAKANPSEMRIFTVNSRGYATRELRPSSERDMARISESMEAQRREMQG